MSSKQHTVGQCRYHNTQGQRRHLLIDTTHRPATGAQRPTLCAYHANRLRATVPAVEPEVLATDLLGDIHDFSTPASVNLFLGNLVKQLACKRVARRDAIALAYISQLLLNSFPAFERAAEAEKKAAEEKETARINALIRQQARERAARRLQQSTKSAVVVRTDGQMTVSPSMDSAGGQA
jgi:hypothetical protein